MDVKGSIAAIKTAFEDSVTQRNNGDVIAAAWAALYFTLCCLWQGYSELPGRSA